MPSLHRKGVHRGGTSRCHISSQKGWCQTQRCRIPLGNLLETFWLSLKILRCFALEGICKFAYNFILCDVSGPAHGPGRTHLSHFISATENNVGSLEHFSCSKP